MQYIPNDTKINVGIIVDQAVPQSCPPFRINLWMGKAKTIRKIVCILTNQLNIVDELLSDRIPLIQRFPRHVWQKFSYESECAKHMLGTRLVTIIRSATSHTGTASLQIRAANRGDDRSTPDETTSTPRPSNLEKSASRAS